MTEDSATPAIATLSESDKLANTAQLAKAEFELGELIKKKKVLDKSLVNLESNLYALGIYHLKRLTKETTYLEETAGFGNIIRGFDQYLNGRASDRRRQRVQDSDRIFSQSSTTISKSLEIRDRENPDLVSEDDNLTYDPSRHQRRHTDEDGDGTFSVLIDRQRKKRRLILDDGA